MKYIGIALLTFNIPLVAGCAGGNVIEQAVPQAALVDTAVPLPPPTRPAAGTQPVPEVVVEAAAPPAAHPPSDPLFTGSGQATTTGTYPNINLEPHGATQQLTDVQRDLLLAQMQALAEAHSQGKVSAAEYERRLAMLRRLAATHSQETIKAIEE